MKYLALFIVILFLVENLSASKIGFSRILNKGKPHHKTHKASHKGKKHRNAKSKKTDKTKSIKDILEEPKLKETDNNTKTTNNLDSHRFIQTDTDSSLMSFMKKEQENIQLTKKFLFEEAKKSTLIENWLTISWKGFNDKTKYPRLFSPEGVGMGYKLEEERLVNENFIPKPESPFKPKVTPKKDEKKDPNAVIPLDKFFFYFRLTNKYMYYTNDDKNINILGSILLETIKSVENLYDENNCIVISSALGDKFQVCAQDQKTAIRWTCYLNKLIRKEDFKECDKKLVEVKLPVRKVIKRKLNQPFIIIPTPQRMCNAGWDYANKGKDWECLCKEGKEQSPIDLPPASKAIQSPAKPLFDFENRLPEQGGKKIKIEHVDHTLRIQGGGFGRVVTLEGSIYAVDEIIFHTPAEHTIDGNTYPMEMQIIHKAITKGDYGRKLILSFLFVGKPARYNKFIDEMEFYNLPNPHDKFRYINHKLFIPNILLDAKDDELSVMNPFSFYTYSGSMTTPPCQENVIHIVGSKPLELSITTIELFKEALRMPDFEDDEGNVIVSEEKPLENSRGVQALNGRAVFHYDADLYTAPNFKKVLQAPVPKRAVGHYEKQESTITNYMYVDGMKPSGIPGAMVVDEKEVKSG